MIPGLPMLPTGASASQDVACIGEGRSEREKTKGQLTPSHVFLDASALQPLPRLRNTDPYASSRMAGLAGTAGSAQVGSGH